MSLRSWFQEKWVDPKTGKKKLIRQTLPAQPTESLPQEETSNAKED